MSAVYLDHNASTPVRPQAMEAMARALAVPGNASSVHGFGRFARRLVEDGREAVAALVGADPTAVVFTSGGTEANILAFSGFGWRRQLVSAIEHPSIARADAEIVPVDGGGVVDLAALERLLGTSPRPALVALMLANHETGVVQPVAEAARIAHAHGAVLHCDAVQAAGRIPVDLGALGADSLALSAHKLGGPPGTGALVLSESLAELAPAAAGGGQEGGRRPGSENVPGIAGFAAAARLAREGMAAEAARLAALRDALEARVGELAPDAVIAGAGSERLANTSCIAVPGLAAQAAVIAFDLAGVAVSAGAACASGRQADSPVLAAMGMEALAGSAIRVSLGWTSGADDVERFVAAFAALAERRARAA